MKHLLNILLPMLVIFSVLCLIFLVLSSFWFVRADSNLRKLRQRLSSICGIDHTKPKEKSVLKLGLFDQRKKIGFKLLGLLNLDLERSCDYPISWWIVVFSSCLVSRIFTLLISFFTDLPAATLFPVFAIILCRLIFSYFHQRRSSQLFRQFPDALATIVRCVRVGIPIQESLKIVFRDLPEPTAQEFGRLADKVVIGISLEAALHEIADRCELPEYKFFATALSLQAKTGGPLAQTLETLAEVIRKRVAMRMRGHALASEARASALILSILPVFAGIVIWALQPSYIDMFFTSNTGRKIILASVVLLLLGNLSMKGIIRKSLT